MQPLLLARAASALVFLAAAPLAGASEQYSLIHGFPWSGVSLFTLVISLLYAGHLAQDRSGLGWRIVLFVLGFPLTFIVSFLVVPGSQRLLGVDLPRHDSPASAQSIAGDSSGSDTAGERDRRSAAWSCAIALMIGVSITFLAAPSTETRLEPLGEGRYSAVQQVIWGSHEAPWLVYRRTSP